MPDQFAGSGQPGSKRSYLAKGLSLHLASSLLIGLALLVGIDGSRISECCGSLRVKLVSRTLAFLMNDKGIQSAVPTESFGSWRPRL